MKYVFIAKSYFLIIKDSFDSDLTDRKPSFILKELKAPLIDLQTCSDYYQKESLLSGVHVSYLQRPG